MTIFSRLYLSVIWDTVCFDLQRYANVAGLKRDEYNYPADTEPSIQKIHSQEHNTWDTLTYSNITK